MINNILLFLWGSLFGYLLATFQIAKLMVKKGYRRFDEIPDKNQSNTKYNSTILAIKNGTCQNRYVRRSMFCNYCGNRLEFGDCNYCNDNNNALREFEEEDD